MCKEKNPKIPFELFVHIFSVKINAQLPDAYIFYLHHMFIQRSLKHDMNQVPTISVSHTYSFKRAIISQNLHSHPMLFCLSFFFVPFFLNSIWIKDIQLITSLLRTSLPTWTDSFCCCFLSCIDLPA